ncbi:MAG: beta-lactamase family protein [Desulfobacteraceae bacterium]|nr:beta-lactamase family protein [Desulfobacteraceae bacterium]
MNRIDALMRRAINEEAFPGGVLLAARYDRIIIHKAYGVSDPFSARAVSCDTIYDLASLTKPLATAASLMHLEDSGCISTKDRLGEILPGFAGSDKAGIRIWQLLCHNSGLPDYRPYYKELSRFPPGIRKQRLRSMLAKEPLVYEPGTVTVYSDPGFMILQWVIEHVSGRTLDRYAEQYIYRPMGIRDLFFIPGKIPRSHKSRMFAPTEALCQGELICGRVHDENAEATGGVAGHAGLFGTAGAVFDIAAEMLFTTAGISKSRVFSAPVVKRFFNIPEGAERGLGFDVPFRTDSSSGRYFTPKRSFGHLGFTGVSFWMDLASGIIVVLLTNRVCPQRENQKIRLFRPAIHDRIIEYILEGK